MNRCTPMRGALVLLLLLLSSAAAGAGPAKPLDSVRIAYDFYPGESVVYRVVTNDTVNLASNPPSVRIAERAMVVRFTCLRRTEEGFVIRMESGDYAARESLDSIPPILRTSDPWVGRTLIFSIAPDGRRLVLYSSADTPGVAPAGPFQPLLLPILGDSASWIGASGIYRARHWLIDNAIPPSPWDGSIFRVVEERWDTLGLNAVSLTYEEIASVSYEPEGGTSTLAKVSGRSRHFFAPELGYPITGELAVTNTLEIRMTDERVVSGVQRITTHYELLDRTNGEARQ